MQRGFAIGLFTLLFYLSFCDGDYFYFLFSTFYTVISTVMPTNTFTAWVFYSSLFALFVFSFPPFFICHPPKTFLPHTPKQRTVLSCPSLQMPLTAQSPMVCELKVVCPAPFLSQCINPAVDNERTCSLFTQCIKILFPSILFLCGLLFLEVCVCSDQTYIYMHLLLINSYLSIHPNN